MRGMSCFSTGLEKKSHLFLLALAYSKMDFESQSAYT